MTKKLLTIICMAVMLTACGNTDSSSTAPLPDATSSDTTTTTTTTTTATEPTTTTTSEEQSVTTTITTTKTEPTVTTTTPEEATTTTTAETTKPKVTPTTKKPTTTTKATTTKAKTTTTAKKTTTTTTITKKVDEPPKDAVKMYSNETSMSKRPERSSKILIEYIPENAEVMVVGDIISNDGCEWYNIYYDGRYGYTLANSLNRLPVDRVDEEICMRINELRKSLGLNELRIDEELCEMAAQRSVEISQTGLPHTRPDGSSFYTILDENGWVFFEDYFTAAENVQSGGTSARLAFEVWRTSDGHYRNMIGNYTAMGISRKPDGTGSWVLLLVRETKE